MKTAVKLVLIVLLLIPSPVFAWSEGGHHLIAMIAFQRLTPEKQSKLLQILAQHPRYAEDFKLPEKLADNLQRNWWLIGRAGYWPDVARRQPTYHRSTWHYELGPSLIIGDRASMTIPERPGPLPESATLDTQELHIAQALELCKRTLADSSKPEADRAIAICWIAHLVADAHHPCHAGSLYAANVFTEIDGDRGANRIPTSQKKNLHALWDQLLGADFNGAIRRRYAEITSDAELVEKANLSIATPTGLDPQTWLEESRQAAVQHVYSQEVLDAVSLVDRGLVSEIETITMPEAYLKNAGRVAQMRAIEAGYRLAATLDRSIP